MFFLFSLLERHIFLVKCPSFIFYGTYKSEVLRIAKNTLRCEDFKTPIVSILNKMVNKGGCCKNYVKCIVNVAKKNKFCYFESFSIFARDIANDITKVMKQ